MTCALLALVGAVGCGSAQPPPNVIVISIDTLRADALGVYGSSEGTSPRIDEFASRATVFENAVTPIGTTYPSHASLFTGLYPRSHGVRWNGEALPESYVTLAERLEARGYTTGAFVSFGGMLIDGGLGQGFATRNPERKGEGLPEGASAASVNRAAREWMETVEGPAPRFLWLHYSEPHTPYEATAFARERLGDYSGPFYDGVTSEELLERASPGAWPESERAALRALYAGQVPDLDREVGSMLDALEAAGWLENAVVVLTADHGEALGEHGDVMHGFLLWQEVLHVPLVIWRSDDTPAPVRRVSTRVGLVDVLPTLLELTGVAAPPSMEGSSLVPALRGKSLADRRLFAEVREVVGDEHPAVTHRRLAVLEGDMKVVREPNGIYAFHLANDPHELDRLEPTALEGAALARDLESYYRLSIERAPPELSEERIRELRSLGYIR